MNVVSHKILEGATSDIHSNALMRLIYISQVNNTEESVFEHIQQHSNDFNKSNNIAGFLCNNDQSFLQCLEGSKEVLLDLMKRIFKDTNHKEMDVILVKPVRAYAFSDWRMHSLNLNNSNWNRLSSHVEKMSDISPFKPETWPQWFVESFIDCVKMSYDPDIDHGSRYVTFDSLGYSSFEKKLVNDAILFYIFIGLLLSTSTALLLFRYDVIA